MDFAQVETKFKELKRKYDAGAITEEEFKAQLNDLMIQDKEGRWWIIGYETGKWYYNDGEKWVQAEPPEPTISVSPKEGFLLHFLPIVVAGVVLALGLASLEAPGILEGWFLATAGAFILWLLLHRRVKARWLMIFFLAVGWALVTSVAIYAAEPYAYWEAGAVVGSILAIIDFALGFGISVLFSKLFRVGPGRKQ